MVKIMFQYRTGENVQRGDVVRTGNHRTGIVKLVITAGTPEAQAWACPEGGILVEEDWDGTPSLLAIPLGAQEECDDLTFVQRGSVPAA